MRFHFVIFCILLPASLTLGQGKKDKGYQYTVDLTRVENDRVYVELTPPAISQSEITFYLPKVVPGTYAVADYGRYVSSLTALDKKGRKLQVEKIDNNTYKIKNAAKLAKISYWVDDTFDTPMEGPEIFWPAGTNIEAGKNFVINTSGFFGYFEGKKEIPFELNIVRPEGFYGSTGLIPVETGVSTRNLKLEKSKDDNNALKKVDIYRTEDYDQLIDSPLMYSKPDTAVIKVANTEVLIGSYSPNSQITAKEIAESIREVLMAQKSYLGDSLPVEKYAFIFYFTDQPVTSYGALEHSYSSMYYMPEMPIGDINQQLRDVAAHEFFHIVTPLTIHSEEIANFDFNDPKMSKHLWMYEGVTEYFASNVQIKYGLISVQEYMQTLQEKMITADQFLDDVPFTDISKFTLDKYHDQYHNVYQKGALIALCLDVKLLKLSQGKYGLQELMSDLSKKFGKDKAFEDDKLFEVITGLTYPEIGEFFNRHVAGTEKLPLKEIFNDVGIHYTEEEKIEDYTLGINNADIGITQVEGKPKLQIASTANQNPMGKALGLMQADVLIKMNGETIPDLGPELGLFIQQQMMSLPTRDTLSYTVMRKDSSGTSSQVELSAPVTKVPLSRKHVLRPDEAATPEQIALRDAWLKPR